MSKKQLTAKPHPVLASLRATAKQSRIICNNLWIASCGYTLAMTKPGQPCSTRFYKGIFASRKSPCPAPVKGHPSNVNCPTKGVATLPTVMVLGVMALIVAVSVTTLAFTELFISQGSAQSAKAHFYAEAGARDALTKIARKKNYLCSTTDCYSIDFSANGCSLLSDCAKVQVTGSDTAKVVTSKGIMKSSTRTLQVNVTLDTDGLITATTWSEVTN